MSSTPSSRERSGVSPAITSAMYWSSDLAERRALKLPFSLSGPRPFSAYLRLMMTSVAAMCHEFIPGMQERGFGRVVNVASVAGRMTVNGDYSYGPTKAYLIALSKGLASSCRDQGVYVMALCPGFTHTEFHESDKLTAMKKATPKFIWYDADVVIREGLSALEKGKDEYTSGRLYRFLVPVLRQRWTRGLLSLLGVKL